MLTNRCRRCGGPIMKDGNDVYCLFCGYRHSLYASKSEKRNIETYQNEAEIELLMRGVDYRKEVVGQ